MNGALIPNIAYFILAHWDDFKFSEHTYLLGSMVLIFYTSYVALTLTIALSTLHIRNGFTMIEAKFMIMAPEKNKVMGGNSGVIKAAIELLKNTIVNPYMISRM